MLYHCEQCSKPFQASPAAKRKFCSRKCWRESINKRVEHICETCGKPFLVKRDKVASGEGRFCSRACADTGWNEPCENCGKLVHRTPSHAKRFKHVFCSRKCYGLWKRQRIECICEQCGAKFVRKPSRATNGRGKYCSQKCYDIARAAQFATLTCEQCGQLFILPISHINSSMYQGRFCSNQCRAIARRLPDSARSVYSHEFTEILKEEIRQRDSHTCQLCGKSQENATRTLAVHHIDYDKANNHPDNLITLCHSCHSKTNYQREYWQRVLQTS